MRFINIKKIDNTKGKRITIFIIAILLIIIGVGAGTGLGILLPWAGSKSERERAANYFNQDFSLNKNISITYNGTIVEFKTVKSGQFYVYGSDYELKNISYESIIEPTTIPTSIRFSNINRKNETKFEKDIINSLNENGWKYSKNNFLK